MVIVLPRTIMTGAWILRFEWESVRRSPIAMTKVLGVWQHFTA